MISSQSAIKQYVVANPSQQSRTLDMKSLLSSLGSLSPNIPSVSSLALTAISNGLQNAQLTSSMPTPSSNMLSASLPIYTPNLPIVAPSMYQMPLNLPNVAPSLTQMASNFPTVGTSSGRITSNLPNERPSLSPRLLGSPSMRPSLSQIASNLPVFTPNLPPALSDFPIASPNCQTAGVDLSVLNNLAIALQLLILNNILNTSPEDGEQNSSCSNTELAESFPNPIKPISVSYVPVNKNENQYTNVPSQKNDDLNILRNANFLGSSNFAENPMMLHNVGGNPISQNYVKKNPNPRTGFTLMSPYEALDPNSAFSDPILSSPYASSTGRSAFNSPYSSFESYSGFDSDLFSMNDIL